MLSTVPRVPIVELVNGENVLLVPPDDPSALSRAAQELGRNRVLCARIAAGAKVLSQSFTWDRIAQRTVDEVFQPLLDVGAARPQRDG